MLRKAHLTFLLKALRRPMASIRPFVHCPHRYVTENEITSGSNQDDDVTGVWWTYGYNKLYRYFEAFFSFSVTFVLDKRGHVSLLK